MVWEASDDDDDNPYAAPEPIADQRAHMVEMLGQWLRIAVAGHAFLSLLVLGGELWRMEDLWRSQLGDWDYWFGERTIEVLRLGMIVPFAVVWAGLFRFSAMAPRSFALLLMLDFGLAIFAKEQLLPSWALVLYTGSGVLAGMVIALSFWSPAAVLFREAERPG